MKSGHWMDGPFISQSINDALEDLATDHLGIDNKMEIEEMGILPTLVVLISPSS